MRELINEARELDRLLESDDAPMYKRMDALRRIAEICPALCDVLERLNDFDKSESAKLLVKNAILKKALTLMYEENKRYNYDGMGNPVYYIRKAEDEYANCERH